MPQEVPLPDDQPSDQATSAVEHSLDAVSCGPLQCYIQVPFNGVWNLELS